MPVIEVSLPEPDRVLPNEIRRFLREADGRIEEFARYNAAATTGFVPCDFETVYLALRSIAALNLASGNTFCEWGSGFGVVASLAALLEFDACGIEIDRDLIDASRTLADDFDLPVEFVHGSFVPRGCETLADESSVSHDGDLFFLATESDSAYDELGLAPDDFDIFFAYPWPGEEDTIDALFEHTAAQGALLLTYSRFQTVHLKRKSRGPSR